MQYRNIGTLRLLLAASVVFSHSFLLANGDERAEPFVRLFGPGNILGLYGVFGFFVLSGFLITRSFDRRATWWSYAASRALRIFPALFVVSAICALAVGPLVTTLPLGEYFRDPGTYAFVVKSSTLTDVRTGYLPGVNFSDGQIGRIVMGTLWTLRPEVLSYALVLAAGLLGLLRLPLIAAAIIVGLWTHADHPDAVSSLGYLAVYFASGAALYFVHQRQRPTTTAVAISIVGLLASAALGYPNEGFAIFGALLLIQLATTERIYLGDGARFGDLSYGIYLIGWPTQQLLVWAFDGELAWLPLFALSLVISLGLAWLSWRLVEEPALTIAARLRARAEASPSRVAVNQP